MAVPDKPTNQIGPSYGSRHTYDWWRLDFKNGSLADAPLAGLWRPTVVTVQYIAPQKNSSTKKKSTRPDRCTKDANTAMEAALLSVSIIKRP